MILPLKHTMLMVFITLNTEHLPHYTPIPCRTFSVCPLRCALMRLIIKAPMHFMLE